MSKKKRELPLIDLLNEVPADLLVSEQYFMDMIPQRKTVVEQYLTDMSQLDKDAANLMAKDLVSNDLPLADTVVLTPIAAHQEAHNVFRTMSQYALQRPSRPFSVVVYPNAPTDDEDSMNQIMATMEELHATKHETDIDLRIAGLDIYDEHASIGTIRRHLWNAALLLAHYEEAFQDPAADVYGINHDIDIVEMSPRYIARIQDRVDVSQRRHADLGLPHIVSRPFTTKHKHAYDPTRPNVAKAAFWHDFAYAQLRPRRGFDAGLVIPFSHYAARGGIEAGVDVGEMGRFTDGRPVQMIPRATFSTSSRRFNTRLQDNNLDKIWTPDSFSATESYRNDSQNPDISDLQLESVVANALDKQMDFFAHRAVYEYRHNNPIDVFEMTRDQAIKDLFEKHEYRKRIAASVMERVVGIPFIARSIMNNYDSLELAEKIVGDE